MADTISKRERIIWVLSIVFILTIFIVAVSRYEKTLDVINERVSELEAEKTDWLKREANLNLQIEDLIKQSEEYARIIDNFPSNSLDIIVGLKLKGFDGNVQDIVNDLIKHYDLIPYKGVLGGKMGFYFEDKIYVLSDKWVFAYFEDGHINGYMLLNYSIDNSKNISWKVIDSYLFGE
mgnify:CR=1 FL=1